MSYINVYQWYTIVCKGAPVGHPQRTYPLEKTCGLENTGSPNRSESIILNRKRFKCERRAVSRYKYNNKKLLSDIEVGLPRSENRRKGQQDLA